MVTFLVTIVVSVVMIVVSVVTVIISVALLWTLWSKYFSYTILDPIFEFLVKIAFKRYAAMYILSVIFQFYGMKRNSFHFGHNACHSYLRAAKKATTTRDFCSN